MARRVFSRTRIGCGALALACALAGPASGDPAEASPLSRCRYSDEGKLVFSPRGVACPLFAAPPPEISMATELTPARPTPAAAPAPKPQPAAPAKLAESSPRAAAAASRASAAAVAPAPLAARPAAAPATTQPSTTSGLAVVSRAELAALLSERDELAEELVRIRDALEYDDREAARRVIDESLARIARHLDGEERLLLKLGAARGK